MSEGYFADIYCRYKTNEQAEAALERIDDAETGQEIFFECNTLKRNQTIIAGTLENGEGTIDFTEMEKVAELLKEGCKEGYLDCYTFTKTFYVHRE